MSRILITPTFRMSYATLAKPRAFIKDGKPRGEPNFSVEMVFEPAALEDFNLWDDEKGEFTKVDVRRVCAEVAKVKWPDLNIKDAVKTAALGWPVIDGDIYAGKRDAKGKKGNDHYLGNKVVKAKASGEYPPRLLYMDGGKTKTIARGTEAGDARAAQLFYSGAYAYAEVSCKATEVEGKYVTFYVNSVKFVKDGERIGGQSKMEVFDGIHGGSEDYDPTAGAADNFDDEIPF